MTELNYRHLRSFCLAAKTGSMTRARGELGLSQPALSLQLRQLEQSLGEKLYRRTRRGIALTDEGRLTLEHAERIFAEGEALVAALRRRRRGPAAVLTLGVSPNLPRHLALEAFFAARRAGQDATVRLAVRPIPALLREAGQGVDLVASEAAWPARQLKWRRAGAAPLLLVAAPHLKRRLASSRGEVPALLPPKGALRDAFDRLVPASTVAAELDDEEAIRRLAIAGHGAALLPEPLVRQDLAEGRLARLGQSQEGAQELWIGRPAQGHRDEAVRAAVDYMMTRFRLEPGRPS